MPFDSPPSNGIPDGNPTPKIVIDHRFSSTVTVGADPNFSVMIVPCLPHPMVFKAATSTAGYTFSTGLVPAALSIYNTSGFWFPMVQLPEYSSYLTDTNLEVDALYAASQFRIVTMATRVTFTGQPLSATGTVTYYTDHANLDKGARRVNDKDVVVFTAVSTPTGSVRIQNLDLPRPIAALTSSTVVQRIDTPMTVYNKHRGEYLYVDIPNNKTIYVDTTLAGANYNTAFTGGSVALAGCMGYDSTWDPTIIQFEGLPVGGTVRIETIVCVEYAPGQNSSVYRLAKPSADVPVNIRETETQVKVTPLAAPTATIPLNQSTRLLR